VSETAFVRAHDAKFFAAWGAAVGGLAATYTPPGGAPVPCSVLIDHNAEQFADGDDMAPVSSVGTTITFRLAELGTVVPAVGGTVAVDGITYALAQRLAGSDRSLALWAVRRDA
jgi:hypothetical protein